ncbi:hypothetical protein Pmani_028836 [Petrolisthes manimaculis]|uniref:Uncharacterized protein n=1 Tax=Petrolisthes manimaculis TaxID=1843537 RepID=A0AAE1NYR1_9EUCA|nr:hypothetical protein Pmani_028836 [Petrolisthes manimaculis]
MIVLTVAGGCGSNDWWLPEVDESEEMQATSQLRSDCLAGNVRVVGAASLTLLDSHVLCSQNHYSAKS